MPQLPRRIKCVPLFRTSCETALKENNIVLQRQRSWCVSKDSQFAEKVADIVGLYLPPPEDAIVISVDEKPGSRPRRRRRGMCAIVAEPWSWL